MGFSSQEGSRADNLHPRSKGSLRRHSVETIAVCRWGTLSSIILDIWTSEGHLIQRKTRVACDDVIEVIRLGVRGNSLCVTKKCVGELEGTRREPGLQDGNKIKCKKGREVESGEIRKPRGHDQI